MRVLFRLVAFLVIVFLLIPKAWGQAQVFPQWTARFHVSTALTLPSGLDTSGSSKNGIAADTMGNSYVALTVCLTVNVPNCPDQESLLIKYDADGHLQWKAWLGGPNHQAS